jgi:hypothetical protein
VTGHIPHIVRDTEDISSSLLSIIILYYEWQLYVFESRKFEVLIFIYVCNMMA